MSVGLRIGDGGAPVGSIVLDNKVVGCVAPSNVL